MVDTIIYTYKKPNYKIHNQSFDNKQWLIESVNSAKLVGYSAEIYTNDVDFCNEILFDKIHEIEDDNLLWDSFKIYVLENRKCNNYFLSDYDVIYKSKIDFREDVDIYFDGWETKNWNHTYRNCIKNLKSKNILNEKYWDYSKSNVVNVGILKINNERLKQTYIKEWKSAYEMVIPYIKEFNLTSLTPTITQYLLTNIIIKSNYSHTFFTEDDWTDYNIHYKHFVGNRKSLNNKSII